MKAESKTRAVLLRFEASQMFRNETPTAGIPDLTLARSTSKPLKRFDPSIQKLLPGF